MAFNRLITLATLLSVVCIFTPALGPLEAGAQDEGPAVQVYRGAIPISRAQIEPLEISPDLLIYPGESVTIVTSGSANVNQHNYERRRCKWAGLKCWYEEKSRSKIRTAGHFDVQIGLYNRANNVETGIQSIETTPDKKGGTITLTYPVDSVFSRPLHLRAYIAKFGSETVNRSNCRNRPSYCSSGELRLSITTDVDARRAALESRLDTYRDGVVPAAQIMSRSFIDPVLLNTPERRRQIQTMMADRLPAWVNAAPRTAQAALVDLVEYALPLSSDPDNRIKLVNARMTAFGNSGDYDSLAETASKAVHERSADCTPSKCSVENAANLITALKNLSTATTEGSVRNRLSDISLSVGMLQKGTSTLEGALAGQPIGENKKSLIELSNIYQSLSDKLMLIRTPAEIDLALVSMTRSVCIYETAMNPQLAGQRFYIKTLCPDLG